SSYLICAAGQRSNRIQLPILSVISSNMFIFPGWTYCSSYNPISGFPIFLRRKSLCGIAGIFCLIFGVMLYIIGLLAVRIEL
ncbi:MAG: hypothetical protein WC312_06220, partial [Candidatus Omnitrophota bacterium]